VKPDRFLADIGQKPATLLSLGAQLVHADPWQLPSRPVDRVVFLGMGSSRYAAAVAARRLRSLGITAVAEYASATGGYPPEPGTLVVAISASGGSIETLDAVEQYAGRSPVVALTNRPGSPVTELADHTVLMHAGPESGGVACGSFVHTGLLLRALEDRLADRPGGAIRVSALCRRVAAATADLLDRRDEWLPRALELLDGPDGVYFLAPAERWSSAAQSALMIREGPRRVSAAGETGDWSHVDVYLTRTQDYRAVLFPGSRYDQQAMGWLRERGSTVVAVGAEVDGARQVVRYAGDTDADIALYTETTIAELVAATWWLDAHDPAPPASLEQ
jgi:glutamine---fructose-6-phosphate transaminase (isomerizing)